FIGSDEEAEPRCSLGSASSIPPEGNSRRGVRWAFQRGNNTSPRSWLSEKFGKDGIGMVDGRCLRYRFEVQSSKTRRIFLVERILNSKARVALGALLHSLLRSPISD